MDGRNSQEIWNKKKGCLVASLFSEDWRRRETLSPTSFAHRFAWWPLYQRGRESSGRDIRYVACIQKKKRRRRRRIDGGMKSTGSKTGLTSRMNKLI